MENNVDTKERILDSAEILFASQGFAGTSMRAITAAAGVNLAAVNYHFGSKEALIGAVFARRIEPINQDRLEALDQFESRGEPSLEQVIEAFLAPPLRASQDPDESEALLHVMQMIGHATSRPDAVIRDLLMQQFNDLLERFTRALARCLPDLSADELLWRFLFMVGAMAHTMSISNDVKALSKGVCDPHDIDRMTRSMVAFCSAGMRAPVTGGERS